MEYSHTYKNLPHASQMDLDSYNFSLKDTFKKIGIAANKVGDKIKDGAQDFADKVKAVASKASPVGIAMQLLRKKEPDINQYFQENRLNATGNILQKVARVAKHRNLLKSQGFAFDGTSYGFIEGSTFSKAFGAYEGEELEAKYKNFGFLDPITISAIASVISFLVKKFGKKKIEDESLTEADAQDLENTTIQVDDGKGGIYTAIVGPNGQVVGFEADTDKFYASSKNFGIQDTVMYIFAAIAVGALIYAIIKAVSNK